VTRDEIENLAQLARLKLKVQEVEPLQKDITAILEYIGQIRAVTGEASTSSVPLVHNVMRDDVVHTSGSPMAGKEEAIRNALPRREDDYNVVRKIIQKDE
jgi:aspartyl/glutamyl-tRNA(Asn/Gln) amidotransferase C subunit